MENNYMKIITYFVYTVVVIFAFLAISSKFSIGGFKLLVVRSGSMEPAIKTGSMVIDKSFNDYNVGNIVTFKNKDKPKETTTHRIANIKYQGDIKLFTTKGDANDSADSEQIAQDRIEGKVIFSIPYFGYAASFARTLPGLIFIIVIPATIIVYEEMKKIHYETKQIVKCRKEKKRTQGKTKNKEGSEVANSTTEVVKEDNENDAPKSG
jgi:signal peptidase